MSTLEDMLPELAGVFAAQESAMENVMSMLTTQVAQLIQENDRQSHRVASLESTQQQLQDALLTLRKAYNSLEDRQKCERVEIVDAIGGVASDVVQLQAKVESELAAFDAKVQSVMAKPEPVVTTVVAGPSESQVVGLLNEHLASMESKLLNEHLAPLESKLTADTDRRMLEVANQSFLQAQQTEEAMKTELEMLEKKFDYLSRVKTEIKDLGKRIDKQDQTLDGMRMGMELLSKSIGTDEVNESDSDDTDHDEDRQEPLRLRVDKAEEMNIMKRISLSSADIQAKIDKNAAALLAEATASTPPEPVEEPTDTARSELRTPMAKETIKELWCRMFARFVQLKRLQLLNGANPERIFRKQNVSVGARVKRLEESATDLEELVEVLEGSIQQNSQGVQALTLMLAQTRLDLNARIDHLNEDRIMQGQMVVGLEEKLDVIEIDLRRVRGSSRRESTQSTSNATVNALTTQQQELALQFTDHAAAFEAVERAVKRLCELDLPAATAKFETAMRDFRGEQAYKSKELAKDLRKTIDRVQKMQTAAQANLQKRTNSLVERLYRDLMTLSKAHLVSLEMVRAVKTPSSATSAPATSDASAGGKKDAVLFDVSLDMLTNVFANFRDDCKAATNLDRDDEDRRDTSPLSALLERATNFQSELERLREQAEKAKRSPVLAFGGEDSSSANFIDRLALVTTAQLRALESLDNSSLRGDSREGDDDATSSDVSLRVQDLVVQLRAVSSLLSLHAELIDPHQRLRAVLSAHDALQKEVRGHDYAIAQFNTAGAMVKTMNARLDSFLELSFSFAKDEDVKKSIEEMLSSSESVRDNVAEQLEAAHAEALQRDERLEHELTQLVARVNKKLDKDELLWTQEVIERQLQSVAKSSLGENDLADIHRLLRNKLDKSYFNTLLLEQRDRAAGSGGGGGAAVGGGGAPGSTPLIGAKCMSCNSEMPPTKAMIQSIVKEQVQLEVHKTLARQQQAPPSATPASPASFNVSTHRSMDKYKKELMAAAAQSPQKPQARR